MFKFFESMILCSIEKHVGFGNLEDLHKYIMGMCSDKYIGEMVETLATLSQLNLIIERFYLDGESDYKQLYHDLRKRNLDWLEEINTKPEIE